jgi:RNA polymerase sigma factor (sigma-70 family)
MTRQQLEVFYNAEYPKLVKILMVVGASIDEAEDAAQKAITDFARRSRAGQAARSNPAAYVLKAAHRFFIKERQRGRERLPRELRGGHLTLEGYLDDQLTAWEEEQYVGQLLGCLTPVQREVVRLVMDGRPTEEIAERLGKTPANVRQHLKHGRDRLKEHPDIAPIAMMRGQRPGPERGARSTAITPEPRKEEVQ